MQYLDLTLPTPEENLALDEALLAEAEAADDGRETLRLWESPSLLVVVGRSSKVEIEVDREQCLRDGVPILRRSSGGAAVVAGPGCLMYAVVLDLKSRPALRRIEAAHRFVLEAMGEALRPLVPSIRCCGTSDLAMLDADGEYRKFSGNSVRVRRDRLLYHGTLLYDFATAAIGRYLRTPPRQPDYRRRRAHEAFVTNLGVDAASLRRAVRRAWKADEPCCDRCERRTAQLVAERYVREAWNLHF